jgi:hypothetical protein
MAFVGRALARQGSFIKAGYFFVGLKADLQVIRTFYKSRGLLAGILFFKINRGPQDGWKSFNSNFLRKKRWATQMPIIKTIMRLAKPEYLQDYQAPTIQLV